MLYNLNISKVFVLSLYALLITGCAAKVDTKSQLRLNPPVSKDNTKGLYEPFATDNVIPYTYEDNDEAYYPIYYYN